MVRRILEPAVDTVEVEHAREMFIVAAGNVLDPNVDIGQRGVRRRFAEIVIELCKVRSLTVCPGTPRLTESMTAIISLGKSVPRIAI